MHSRKLLRLKELRSPASLRLSTASAIRAFTPIFHRLFGCSSSITIAGGSEPHPDSGAVASLGCPPVADAAENRHAPPLSCCGKRLTSTWPAPGNATGAVLGIKPLQRYVCHGCCRSRRPTSPFSKNSKIVARLPCLLLRREVLDALTHPTEIIRLLRS